MTASARKAGHVRHPAGTKGPQPATQGRTPRDRGEAARVGEVEERHPVLVPRRLNIEQPVAEESEAGLDGLPVLENGDGRRADVP